MTFSELQKELQVSQTTINSFIQYGLIAENWQADSKNLKEEDVAAVRKCCLFRMLGYTNSEIAKMKFPDEMPLKTSLSEHIKAILEDTENTTQAAIVLQNIKREEESFEEMDPVPYLEHLSELRARGGSFYDLNSGRLANDDSPWKRIEEQEKAYRKAHDSFSNHIIDAEEKYKRMQQENEESKENSKENESDSKDNNETENQENEFQGTFYKGFGPFGYGIYSRRSNTSSGYYDSEEKTEDGHKICPHPILRYAARLIDQTVYSIFVDIFFGFGLGLSIATDYTLELWELVISFLLMCLCEPLVLSVFGTTLGKWVLGIKVRKHGEERKLTLSEAANRTFKMARYGMGFMIPIYSFFKEIKSYQECRMEKVLPWDEDCSVEAKNNGFFKIFAFIICMFVLVNVSDIIDYQSMIPSHKGNITVDQFYDNCSQVAKYFSFKYSPDNTRFKLTTDANGYVTSVTYEETMTSQNTISSEAIYMAFFAFAATTKGSNGLILSNDDVLNTIIRPYTDYTYNYCDVVVTNKVVNDGYKLASYLGSPVYVATKDDASLKMTFTLTK